MCSHVYNRCGIAVCCYVMQTAAARTADDNSPVLQVSRKRRLDHADDVLLVVSFAVTCRLLRY